MAKQHRVHRCCLCGDPACYGEGVDLLRGEQGTWWCHVCYGPPLERPRPWLPVKPPPLRKPDQGRLL